MSQDPQERFAGTRPVAPQHAFDIPKLAAFMRANVDDFSGDLQVEQFKGGQSNPTFLLTAGGKQYVMRRKPPGTLLPSAHAVDREYRVISALAATDVPVAKSYALCEDDAVIGSAFYIMDYVQGRILWNSALPGFEPAERAALFAEMNRVIAALHSVDYEAVGLGTYGKPGNYLERQVARWTKQYRASETERIEAVENLIDWLPQNIPAADETRIVHGDYRIDNVIFHPTEPRILAVLDWELSTLGHPLADFAYHCMTWRMHPGQSRGMAGLPFTELGIPTEDEYIATYCKRTGRDGIPKGDWEYYMVFNMFRLVGILQGIAKRAQLGNASSADAVETGKRARPLAELAWQYAERIRSNS
ncbi:MAG TPA: phosphotransferase [Noviherbaspirillum sp.]|jgi:aminoglycoside phosphotransferase (APT) family kinase protein|uniref:phosphotransferase n=1 Tax=Noviherbaspirillum sp. TaxID=1926288 RepID=UPI002DDD1B02|nr:phosphotransferase [Noviherbaspirillum sp.]HEV2610038.1 phosphotransferase [Noviherbaspirillum sp.]